MFIDGPAQTARVMTPNKIWYAVWIVCTKRDANKWVLYYLQRRYIIDSLSSVFRIKESEEKIVFPKFDTT